MYFYIPQNAWGLIEGGQFAAVASYSNPGGPCGPVALWCEAAQRAGYTHFDGNQNAVNGDLVRWLKDDQDDHVITIYAAHQADAEMILQQIDATGFGSGEIVEDSNPDQYWGCQFTDHGPQWVDVTEIPADQLTMTPDSWSDYWPGAPEWNDNSTFNNAIVSPLTGFIANYNGRFYFDFA